MKKGQSEEAIVFIYSILRALSFIFIQNLIQIFLAIKMSSKSICLFFLFLFSVPIFTDKIVQKGIHSILFPEESANLAILNRGIGGKKAEEILKIDLTNLALSPGANPILEAILEGLKGYFLGAQMRHRGRGERPKQTEIMKGEWPPQDWMELSDWMAIWQDNKRNLLFTAFAPNNFEEIRRKLDIDDRKLLKELANLFNKTNSSSIHQMQNGLIRFEFKLDEVNGKQFVIEQIHLNEKGKELRQFYQATMHGNGQKWPNKLLGVFRAQQIEPNVDLIFALLLEEKLMK